jgi:iron complex outermembrane receptor protein
MFGVAFAPWPRWMRAIWMARSTVAAVLMLVLAMAAAASAQTRQEDPQPPSEQQKPPTVTEAVTVVGQQPSEKLSLDQANSTASRLGLTPRETPATVTIVPRDLIERRGAIDTQEILNSVPGMTAAAPPGSAGSVSYRGFGASQLTQLFNGLTVQYDAIAARPVDSWIYDRVEVIGGPSTFLYGAGAVGGSINYITKIADHQHDAFDARVSYGSYGTSELAAGLNRRVNAGAVLHTLRGDVSRTGTDGYVDDNARTAWTSAASWRMDAGGKLSHTAAVEYQHEDVDRPYWGTPLLNPTTGAGRIDARTRFKNYNARDGIYQQDVVWARSLVEYRPSTRFAIRNTLYHYDALRDYRNVEVYRYDSTNSGVIRSSPLLQRHDQTLTGNRIEVQHTSRLGGFASSWAGGLDISANQQTRFPRSLSLTVSTVDPLDFTTEAFFDVPGMVPGFTPDRTNDVSTLALFVENRTQLTSALSLVTGLRHDRIDLDVTNHRTATAIDPELFTRTYRPTTGRIGVTYALARAANAYVQYSTAADPPAGILTTANFSQVRNFDLTTGRQVEAGSKFDFWRGRGAATIAAFAITRKNLAIPDPSDPTITQPIGQQSSRGLELASSVRLTRALSLQGNFACVDAQYDDFFETVSGVALSRAGNEPANTPARVANLWASYAVSSRLDAGLDARYVSSRFGNAANTVWDPAYTLFGAYVTYRLRPGTTLTGRVRNLTDAVYARSITGTPMFFLGAPRTFELSLRVGL